MTGCHCSLIDDAIKRFLGPALARRCARRSDLHWSQSHDSFEASVGATEVVWRTPLITSGDVTEASKRDGLREAVAISWRASEARGNWHRSFRPTLFRR
jgi:hypothetical protein